MSNKTLLSVQHKVAAKQEAEIRPPSMYKIVLMNDDYTPMDFVVKVLVELFFLPSEVATNLMLQVHQKGRAECGLYTKDVAETKVTLVNEFARMHEYPLLCVVERE